MGSDVKICNACSQLKTLAEFGKNKQNRDGLESKCRICKASIKSKYRGAKHISDMKKWREDNADYVKQKKHESYVADKERIKTKSRQYTKDNPEKVKAARAKHYKNNSEVIKADRRKYYAENTAKSLECSSNWRKNNLGAYNALGAKRHAAKMLRVPSWSTPADVSDIKSLYQKSRSLTEASGVPHEVDHIIPLQGVLVSGLHTPANLQVITKEANAKKHNSFDI